MMFLALRDSDTLRDSGIMIAQTKVEVLGFQQQLR